MLLGTSNSGATVPGLSGSRSVALRTDKRQPAFRTSRARNVPESLS